MRTIRISMLHAGFCKNVKEFERGLKFDGAKHGIHFEIDNKKPEFLFVSEQIYYKKEIMKKFLKLCEGG